jgi:hypothetical protein
MGVMGPSEPCCNEPVADPWSVVLLAESIFEHDMCISETLNCRWAAPVRFIATHYREDFMAPRTM